MQAANTKDPITLIRATFLIGFVSMGQVAAFLFFYSAVVEIRTIFFGPMKGDLAYGLGLYYSLYLIGGLAAVNAAVQIFADRVATRWSAAVGGALIWLFYWVGVSVVYPYRFLLVSASGLASFLLAMIFLYRIPAGINAERRIDVA